MQYRVLTDSARQRVPSKHLSQRKPSSWPYGSASCAGRYSGENPRSYISLSQSAASLKLPEPETIRTALSLATSTESANASREEDVLVMLLPAPPKIRRARKDPPLRSG